MGACLKYCAFAKVSGTQYYNSYNYIDCARMPKWNHKMFKLVFALWAWFRFNLYLMNNLRAIFYNIVYKCLLADDCFPKAFCRIDINQSLICHLLSTLYTKRGYYSVSLLSTRIKYRLKWNDLSLKCPENGLLFILAIKLDIEMHFKLTRRTPDA